MRPHYSELRTHRQLEHPTSTNHYLHGSVSLISFCSPFSLYKRLFYASWPANSLSSEPGENHRINKMPDFKPKTPVNLAPPKDDPISLEELAKADGKNDCVAVRTSQSLICLNSTRSLCLSVSHMSTINILWMLD